MSVNPAILDHQAWLGYLQPDGLVVSPAAFVDAQAVLDRGQFAELQEKFAPFVGEIPPKFGEDKPLPSISDLPAFLRGFLDWPEDCLATEIPESLKLALPEGETLAPDFAFREAKPTDPARPWLLLIQQLPPGTDFDTRTAADTRAWNASPAQRFERLLRGVDVPIGLLASGTHLRLIYAPRGENSGSLTFPVAAMTEIAGRPILAALHLLLGRYRLLAAPRESRLSALLQRSREYQASVSTTLAGQVLEALYELLRGFEHAHAQSGATLLREVLAKNPDDLYSALLTVLMRLVFVLFAEDRDLLPASGLYRGGYSVHGLFERLRDDAERYPDTLDLRYGAWAQLCVLFRLVHHGCKHPRMAMPARRGHLFDPERFPFLEGREKAAQSPLPLVSDGTLYRVLEKLMLLHGERLSYRTLDVEEIGSVYQTVMGFRLEIARGQTIALTGKRKHKSEVAAPIAIDLDALLAVEAKDRAKWLKERAGHELTGNAGTALKQAATVEDLLAALEKRIARRATPHLVQPSGLLLQPTDERRRSGSHYTPRALTEPIVRKTLAPILAKLATSAASRSSTSSDTFLVAEGPFAVDLGWPDNMSFERDWTGATTPAEGASSPRPKPRPPTPKQILDLKICDMAIGSGAFQVETCRQLGDALVEAWGVHGGRPPVPPDEDELLLARRLVAQRCLYGVDRNPMAVDLAKLSLWLATLARDHPFTFLDHAIRTGDSLVGLSRRQLGRFHWDESARIEQFVFGQDELEKIIARVSRFRREILDGGDDMLPELKRQKLALADEELVKVRRAGDLCIRAFFDADTAKARNARREEALSRFGEAAAAARAGDMAPLLAIEKDVRAFRGEAAAPHGSHATHATHATHASHASHTPHPVTPFHWQIEFPEVFDRENGGFDAIVGNPPYGGKNTVIEGNRDGYLDWLKTLHAESHGNADLVAHFFRRAFTVLRRDGTFGLIATNTIRQGDTRHSGLRWICVRGGGTIYAARRRYKWAGAAAVVVSVVWVVKGTLPAPFDLDGKTVPIITAYLFHDGGHENPATLAANVGRSFIGSYVLGMGFTFDDTDKKGIASPLAEMERLIAKDPRNAERIFPYLGGDEVNDSPTHAHHRYVINFADFPLRRAPLDDKTWQRADEKQRDAWLRSGIVPLDYPHPVAADWPDLLEIVERKVKPERAKQGSIVNPERWYRFARPASDFVAATARLKLERVLVCCLHQEHWIMAKISATSVFSHALALFTLPSEGAFALMQSRAHEIWARFFASSLEERLRYTPSDCFETFPFPAGWETDAALEAAGREYYEHRAALMVRHGEGLTTTYNRFHAPAETDPGLLRLRALHAQMDRAVLAAYGWLGEDGETLRAGAGEPPTAPLTLACEFIPDYVEENADGEPVPKSIRHRWPDPVRDEVLARLLKLNAERAEEERLLAAAAAPEPKRGKRPKKSPGARPQPDLLPSPQSELFD